jgi:Haem-binding uptake, Tiki superfamily, ChaN
VELHINAGDCINMLRHYSLLLLALQTVACYRMCTSPTTSMALSQSLGVDRRQLLLGAASAVSAVVLLPGQQAFAVEEPQGYDLSLERIFDTRVGSYLPAHPERLFRAERLPEASVICIGEHHTHSLDHRAQFRSIAALHRAAPGEPLAIGLEMFYKTHQPALNR